MEKVSIIKCKRYQKDVLKEAISRAANLLGGFEKLIKPGEKVLLKPNLLLAANPQKAVTTHPLFVEAVVELIALFTDMSRITIADSPGAGMPYNRENLEKVYRETGIMDVAQRTGCVLNLDNSYRTITLKQGKAVRKVDIITPALEADKIVNLCKFKTHTLTSMTGAVKNMFGAVSGFSKVGHHLRFTDIEVFSQMLVDVAYQLKPVINIMDGILGMEGEGPGMRGTPREIGLVLASLDPLAMDEVVARMMGLDRELFPMLRLDNIIPFNHIQIEGEIEKDYVLEDFILPRTVGKTQLSENRFLNKHLIPRAKTLLNPFPMQDTKKCTLCGACHEVCPQNAIRMKGNRLKINYSICSRCFCCSELCPEGAMDIRYKWLSHLLINRAGWAGKAKK